MEELLVLFIIICCFFLGFIGSILPVIPGPIFSYIGLISAHFFTECKFSNSELLIFTILTVIVFCSDYILQFIGVKKFGGGKYSIYGALIGVICGLFFSPLGLILGPFFGAFLGALMDNKKNNEALVIAFGALIGFVFGTFIKIAFSIYVIYFVIQKCLILF